MKKMIWLFSLVLIWSSFVNGQSSQTAEESSLLWKISGKNLTAPSYLFGTIHMIGKNDYFFTETMQEAFKAAEQVTFEINMEEMSDMSAMMPIMMKAFMSNNTTLKDLLDEASYKIVEDHFSKIGLPLMLLERIKPMFLSALSAEDLMKAQTDNEEVVSYEFELMDMARSQNKTVDGLETAAFQMSMFDSIPYDVQARMLVASIQQNDQGADEDYRKMIDLYKAQDITAMGALITEEGDELANYEQLLLTNRNRNWIPVMANMMSKKATFFAVGAGHLGGSKGVIALLRAAGYTVTSMR
jgi:hypothetical protein